MKSVLEYIMLNYTWMLGSAIIILLAIIGYYADKTNFGQGKNKEQSPKEDEINFEEIEQSTEEVEKEEVEETQDIESEKVAVEEPQIQIDSQKVNSEVSFEEKFEKFDKEFNEILPEKEIIDDELLDEIDSLSLDKTQKIKLTDIPDLDDVELPKIKSMPKEEDIWKF